MYGKFIAVNTKDKKKYKFEFKDEGNFLFKDKNFPVVFEEKDGMMFIVYKKKKYQVDIVDINQNKYNILVNNVGYSFSVETPISFKRKELLEKTIKDNKNLALTAPMPGKIVEILVEENTEVKAGDPILILEAMKMQNEITIDKGGKVKKINVRPGDLVMKDDILVELA